jgi:hypothetical protein
MIKQKIPTAREIIFGLSFIFLIVLIFPILLSLVPSSYAETQHRKPHKAPVKAVDPPPAAALYQPPPPTPEQGPSSPPEVTFKGSQLTIVARNSTMADVLAAVKQKTGASVEMPASSGERVVGRFGPGAPRDVMAQLLNGSHYDYVLLGSPADPRALKKVVLIARAIGPEAVGAQQNPAVTQNLQAVPNVSADEEQENAEMPPDAQQEVQPEAQQEEPQPEQPGQQNPTVKTPEQLLRELQQQQQQQQQNAPPQ